MLNRLLTFSILILHLSLSAQLQSFKNFSYSEGLNYSKISCLTEDDYGNIWLGTGAGKLVKFNGNEFAEIDSGNKNSNFQFTSIISDKNEIIFSAKEKGVFSYNSKSKSLTKIKLNIKSHGDFLSVQKLKNQLYILTAKGIFEKSSGEVRLIKHLTTGMEDFELSQAFRFKDAIYFVTNHGTYKIQKNKVFKISSNACFAFIDSGTVYFYDSEQQFFFNENSEKSNFKIELLKNERITNSHTNSVNQSNILTTSKNRILELKGNTWKEVILNNHNPLKPINSIYSSKNGSIWIGSSFEGLFRVSNTLFTKIDTDPILSKDIVHVAKNRKTTIITTIESKSYIGSVTEPNSFKPIKPTFFVSENYKDKIILGSDNGIYSYDIVNSKLTYEILSGEKIQDLEINGDNLWVAVS